MTQTCFDYDFGYNKYNNYHKSYLKSIEQTIDENELANGDELHIDGNKVKDSKLTNNKLPDKIQHFHWLNSLLFENIELDGIPHPLPDNLDALQLSNINMKTTSVLDCSSLPKTLTTLVLKKINLHKIINLNSDVVQIGIENSPIEDVYFLSKECVTLHLKNTLVQSIPQYLSCITNILLSYTPIPNIDCLSDTVNYLQIIKCNITEINKLPLNLIEFECTSSELSKINCAFPSELTQIILKDNLLFTIPNLPNKLVYCNVSSNVFKTFDNEIPESLIKLNLENNDKIEIQCINNIKEKHPNLIIEHTCFDPTEYNTKKYWNDTTFYSNHKNYRNYDYQNNWNPNLYDYNDFNYNTNMDTDTNVNNYSVPTEYRESNPNYISFSKKYTL